MANVLVEENSLSAIANAIREKNGSNATYKPAEMAPAILAIESGGGGGEVREPVLEPLEVTQNGVYIPGEGVDGFSQVSVSVEAEMEMSNGIVVNATDANGNWTDITIYGNVPANMFKSNAYLTNVTLMDNVGSIGASAFYGCAKLVSVHIPEGVTEIGSNAFRDCSALLGVTIPEGVTVIGAEAFRGCSSLLDTTIPATATSIGNRAFGGCTALTTVHWGPLALSAAGSSSYPIFDGCSALANFIFPAGITKVPDFLLKNSTGSLGSLEIPDSVTTIGGEAFRGCTGITSITIPAGITSIGTRAFAGCTAVATVYWNPIAATSTGSSNYPIFDGCSALANFIIAVNVTAIPGYLLKNCSGIVSIAIPDSVKTIGTEAFRNCSKLTSVQIGETADCAITTIDKNAFNASALTEIIIYAAADSVTGSPWGASSATITWAV